MFPSLNQECQKSRHPDRRPDKPIPLEMRAGSGCILVRSKGEDHMKSCPDTPLLSLCYSPPSPQGCSGLHHWVTTEPPNRTWDLLSLERIILWDLHFNFSKDLVFLKEVFPLWTECIQKKAACWRQETRGVQSISSIARQSTSCLHLALLCNLFTSNMVRYVSFLLLADYSCFPLSASWSL